MEKIFLAFYGVGIVLESDSKELLHNIERDFKFFLAETQGENVVWVEAFLKKGTPPPDCKPSLVKDTCKCFDYGGKRFVDYNGNGTVEFSAKDNKVVISSLGKELLHELVFVWILSMAGRELDKKGLHRIHALGIANKKNAFILIAPLYGGKTTLALELLRRGNVGFLSEDTPLLKGATAHPFPIRVGACLDTDLSWIPKEKKRVFKRMKYHDKILVDASFFEKNFSGEKKVSNIILLRKSNEEKPQLKRINRLLALPWLFKYLVIGWGVPQPKEFSYRFDVGNLVEMAIIGISRSIIALRVLLSAKAHVFSLSKNAKENAVCIENLALGR